MECNSNSDNCKLPYNILYSKYTTLPIEINNNDIDILLNNSDSSDNKNNFTQPPFGMYI